MEQSIYNQVSSFTPEELTFCHDFIQTYHESLKEKIEQAQAYIKLLDAVNTFTKEADKESDFVRIKSNTGEIPDVKEMARDLRDKIDGISAEVEQTALIVSKFKALIDVIKDSSLSTQA